MKQLRIIALLLVLSRLLSYSSGNTGMLLSPVEQPAHPELRTPGPDPLRIHGPVQSMNISVQDRLPSADILLSTVPESRLLYRIAYTRKRTPLAMELFLGGSAWLTWKHSYDTEGRLHSSSMFEHSPTPGMSLFYTYMGTALARVEAFNFQSIPAWTRHYSRDGNTVHMHETTASGITNMSTESIYSNTHLMASITTTWQAEEVLSLEILQYSYRENGTLQHSRMRNLAGNTLAEKHYSYGEGSTTTTLQQASHIVREKSSTYTPEGLVETVTITGSPEISETWKYSYDKHGNPVEISVSNAEPHTTVYLYAYTYDSFNNWRSCDLRIRKGEGAPVFAGRIQRSISYFQEEAPGIHPE
jgi:hypothetical protein